MTDAKQRKIWIDVLKGIAIMSVVLSHAPWLPGKALNVIACFAVPLFCFVSGYFFNPNVSFQDHIRRRFNSLLKPYFFTLAIVILAYVIVIGTPSILWYLFWTIYGNGPNLPKLMLHLFYLPNIFFVTLFVWALFRYLKFLNSSIGGQLLFIIGFLVLGALGIHLFWNVKVPISVTNYFMTDGNLFLINGLLKNPEYSKEALLLDKQFVLKGLPWSLDFVLITSAFFMSGYFVKKNRLEYLFNKGAIALIMLLIFIAFHSLYNYTINLYIRCYDNLFISTAECFTAFYVLIYSSFCIAKMDNKVTQFIKYVGRYSLIVYIFHPIMQSKVYGILLSILPSSINLVAIIPAFAAGVLLPLLLNWALLERFMIFRVWYYREPIAKLNTVQNNLKLRSRLL